MKDDFGMKVPLYKSYHVLSSQGAALDTYVTKISQDNSVTLITNPLRLLTVSNAAVLPTRSTIRILATAEDVIHS